MKALAGVDLTLAGTLQLAGWSYLGLALLACLFCAWRVLRHNARPAIDPLCLSHGCCLYATGQACDGCDTPGRPRR